MATVNVLARLPKDFFELLGSSKWKDRKDALEKLLSELDVAGPCARLDQSVNYGELMGELKQIIWKDSNVVVVTLAVRVLSGIARGFASKFTKYVPMFMTIVFEKFKDKKTSVREALNECVDAVASTSHADCFVASLTEVFEKKGVNPDIKANIDRWIYRTLLHYAQANPPNEFIIKMAPFIAQHICDGDADVRDAACMACAGIMRLIGEKTTSTLIKGWIDDKVKQKKVNEYHEKAMAEAEEVAKSVTTEGTHQDDDQNHSSGDKVMEDGVSGERALAIDPWELLEEVEILGKLPNDFSEMVGSKQWKDRLNALEDLNGILTKSERLSSKEDYGEIVAMLAKVLAKDVNVNVAAMSAKCLKGFACGTRFKFSQFAPLVLNSAIQKFKEKKTVLREPLVELVDSIAVITPLSSYIDEVNAGMGQSNPQIKSQTALFIARLLKQHNAETLPVNDFNSLAPQINKLITDPDAEVRDASYCLLGAAMKSLNEKQMNALFSDIVNDNIRMAKVKEQHAKVVEECGNAASDAIIKLLKVIDNSATIPSTENAKKTSECGKDSACKSAKAIGHNKRPLQNTRAQDQHLARMIAARKGGTPKASISSSVSTPHLSVHPRNAVNSSANRAASPQTNGTATQTPRQYSFTSVPKKMASAGDIRRSVATAPQSARSHHVVVSQARGVEEHIARLAQRRAEQSKAQNTDDRSHVRNPSVGRSVPQKATASGCSSARGAGPFRLFAKNAPSTTTNGSLPNRPITAPVSRYNPSNESDQNANKLPHRPKTSAHCPVPSHRVKSYHGSRLPLPSSARQ